MENKTGSPDALKLPGYKILPAFMRQKLRRQVLGVIQHDGPAPDYDAPKGDPGLFGPHSVTWKIHADFPSMMAGGLAALMIQMLHPLALAGVWDHSRFREDALGRLRNTTAFVGRTTYAPAAPAEAAIERVRKIHDHVHGTAADGRPYSANDPHLLTWVHSAECWAFLQAYQRYCQAPVPLPEQDRYLREMAGLAEALGASDIPQSMSELEVYFARMQAELVFDERTRNVFEVLDSMQLPMPLANFGRRLFIGAGAALLPDWALRLMVRSGREQRRDRLAARGLQLLAPSVRDVMARGGLAWRACRRMDVDYQDLWLWPA